MIMCGQRLGCTLNTDLYGWKNEAHSRGVAFHRTQRKLFPQDLVLGARPHPAPSSHSSSVRPPFRNVTAPDVVIRRVCERT
eukprot:gene8934-biopygen4561